MCDLYNGQPCPECELEDATDDSDYIDFDDECPHDATCVCDEETDRRMELRAEYDD